MFCVTHEPESSLKWNESSSWPGRFASIWNVTFAVCDSVKLICTWPVELSEGEPKFWVPLFGHRIAAPPEAAESLTTVKGENRLWPDRLSSSTVSDEPPEVLDELDDELLLDEDELEELLLEDELLLELEEDEPEEPVI